MKKFGKILLCFVLVLVIIFSFYGVYSAFKINKPANVYYTKALPGKIMAMTIPPFGIFIEQRYISEGSEPGTILAHERIHWLQYQERGLFKFYYEYFGGLIKHGRLYNELEKDARKRSSVQSIWENFIPEIRNILKSEKYDGGFEVSRPLSIFEESDITGDDIPEALVDLQTGGAYTSSLMLFILDNGKPTKAKFVFDGKVSNTMFLDGASVRHGFSVVLLPEKNVIYSGSWSTDDNGKRDSCGVEAYKWNSQNKTFDFNQTISNEIETNFCNKLEF